MCSLVRSEASEDVGEADFSRFQAAVLLPVNVCCANRRNFWLFLELGPAPNLGFLNFDSFWLYPSKAVYRA